MDRLISNKLNNFPLKKKKISLLYKGNILRIHYALPTLVITAAIIVTSFSQQSNRFTTMYVWMVQFD